MLADAHDDPINTIIGLLILFKGLRLLFCGWPCMKQMWTVWSLPHLLIFFCWRLLGLIPGGAPFSQLNKGVNDAMVESTDLVECQFMTKTCKKAIFEKQKTTHRKKEKEGNHPQIGTRIAEEGSAPTLAEASWIRVFFFEQSCAHHCDSASHLTVL